MNYSECFDDDIDDIEEPMNLSNPYSAIYSVQNYNAQKDLHVFTTSIDLSNMSLTENDIHIVGDTAQKIDWELTKAIQRNISENRLRDIEEKYLKDEEREVKFFPSITVVILPIQENTIVCRYNKLENEKVTLPDGREYERFKGIDGFFVRGSKTAREEHLAIKELRKVNIKWDKNKLQAFVVDGQHRLKAAKNTASIEGSWKIPIILLIFEPDVRDAIKATRRLFIDVNNTPKRVAEQRLIFIDDNDILRRFTAKIVGVDVAEELDQMQKSSENKEVFSNIDENFISRLIVREDPTDDQLDERQRVNSNLLYPWEFIHILTLHETIVKGIIFSYSTDYTADLRAIARYVCENALKEIIDCQIKNYTESEYRDRLLKNPAPLERESQREIIIQIYKNKYDLEIAMESVDDSIDEEEKKQEISEKKQEFEYRFKNKYTFVFSSEIITDLLMNELNIPLKFITNIIKKLWFVKDLRSYFQSLPKNEREQIYDFIEYLHFNRCPDKNLDYNKSNATIRENLLRYYEGEAPPDKSESKRRKILEAFIEEALRSKRKENLLGTVVGQQALFILGQKDFGFDAERTANYVNNIKDIFYADYKMKLYVIQKNHDNYWFWGGILIRPTQDKKYKMLPKTYNAKYAASLLSAVIKNVRTREDAVNNKMLDQIKRLSRQVGTSVREQAGLTEKTIGKYFTDKGKEEIAKYLGNSKSTDKLYEACHKVVKEEQDFSSVNASLNEVLGMMVLPQLVDKIKNEESKSP